LKNELQILAKKWQKNGQKKNFSLYLALFWRFWKKIAGGNKAPFLAFFRFF